ncbi:DUF998 domain-containing protein [Clavibacter zhangzhiyongii]|uniref:DUF998 domain-containing protein n=1 Tax=Clavibacter zhangzhiyongii TaxID=2768071 RepID=A0A7L7Z367_9MICO|nr:DUF998 domain-containing protein [Clavibacter zhangzhiyongii]QOD44085.1 DUF998 domain-containing protein [Clavibacter zhangzhiyongii]
MTRIRWGATLWVLGLVAFPAQIVAAAMWPRTYSWRTNFISDLGVTACEMFDVGTRVERYICSPAHALANGSTIVNGLLLTAGAVLLWSAWPRRRTGRLAMALLMVGGLLVALVGFLPWDVYPEHHDAVALAQAAAQWVGMIVLVFALRGAGAFRGAAVLTAVSVVVSISGFVLFIDAIDGGPSFVLGLGITERIAFDTLAVWGAVMGVIVLKSPPAARANSLSVSGKHLSAIADAHRARPR